MRWRDAGWRPSACAVVVSAFSSSVATQESHWHTVKMSLGHRQMERKSKHSIRGINMDF